MMCSPVVLCMTPCWGPIPIDSALELLRLQGPEFSLPRPPLGRQLPAPCPLAATPGAIGPFVIK